MQNQISICLDPHLNSGLGLRPGAGLSPQVNYFIHRSKAVLLLIFYVYFCLLFGMPLCASVYFCLVALTSWLSYFVSYCEFVTFPLVSWIRYGTWLYRFLIFAPLLTLLECKTEKRNSQREQGHPVEQTRSVFCTCDWVWLAINLNVSITSGEWVRCSKCIARAKKSSAAVNQMHVINDAMKGCKNLKID